METYGGVKYCNVAARKATMRHLSSYQLPFIGGCKDGEGIFHCISVAFAGLPQAPALTKCRAGKVCSETTKTINIARV